MIRPKPLCSLFMLLAALVLFYESSEASSFVDSVCRVRCLRGQGGVLCKCTAAHFSGKRSEPSVWNTRPASLYGHIGDAGKTVRHGESSRVRYGNGNRLPQQYGPMSDQGFGHLLQEYSTRTQHSHQQYQMHNPLSSHSSSSLLSPSSSSSLWFSSSSSLPLSSSSSSSLPSSPSAPSSSSSSASSSSSSPSSMFSSPSSLSENRRVVLEMLSEMPSELQTLLMAGNLNNGQDNDDIAAAADAAAAAVAAAAADDDDDDDGNDEDWGVVNSTNERGFVENANDHPNGRTPKSNDDIDEIMGDMINRLSMLHGNRKAHHRHQRNAIRTWNSDIDEDGDYNNSNELRHIEADAHRPGEDDEKLSMKTANSESYGKSRNSSMRKQQQRRRSTRESHRTDS